MDVVLPVPEIWFLRLAGMCLHKHMELKHSVHTHPNHYSPVIVLGYLLHK